MRRRAGALVLVAVGAAIALSSGSGGVAAATEPPPPARLLVTSDEYTLTLSRQELVRGEAIIQNHNRGEDPHDLRLRRIGHARIRTIPETAPGETETLSLRMGVGRWELWCSLGNHRDLGMETTLRVRG